mmetsp:Transcript_68609/g.135724  ORF Transcript_68609/g.135724 Transcript_68609/m.135724 type:complete len:209 (+) Transcript_68609:62-688(+)|eukprot:CAMPEP_0172669294 /NCGR_PEP_ID=MMETSP1074-20121228/9591_1 /TAXON_ID=2916 /ORGANISM="Ceratium fusus, Strain PA161109" /LENGTH=208 /DNA_ID=CAMNT_0013486049 /DNA_START=54 /DNA_END=680 /DNA_ORIENTATION=+
MAETAAAQQKPQKISGKVIVAGPANTGKTCLLERFVHDHYAADDEAHGPTLGVDCHQKSVYVDGTEVHLYLYDTAGQERFADMASSYYRVGQVCLLCFDMSQLATFDSTVWWKRKVSDHNSKCTFILVGTKEDLVTENTIDMGPISRWAEENGIPYYTTSALKGGQHVKFLFDMVAEKCVRLNREKQIENGNTHKLDSSFSQPKGKCC